MILEIFTMLGFVFLGFIISEAAAAFFDKQGKGLKPYFSIIGIEFNEKDAQRLVLSLAMGLAIMYILPYATKWFDYEINGRVIYIITGISPTTVIFFIKKKFKEKTGIKDSDFSPMSGPGGNPNPDHEQH